MEYKIGFIGTGRFAKKRAKALEKIGKKISFCYDTSNPECINFAKEFNLTIKQNPLELITSSDIIFICTPNKYHKEYLSLASAYNKIIFCEKPLTITSNDLKDIKGNIRMGSNLRFFPIVSQLTKLLQTNYFGTIHSMELNIGHNGKLIKNHWNENNSLSGGGVLMDNGIHLVSLLSLWSKSPITLKDIKFQMRTPLIEDYFLAEVKSSLCENITLSGSWKRDSGYCDITIIGEINQCSIDVFDSVLKTSGQEFDCTSRYESIELELLDFFDNLKNPNPGIIEAKRILEFIESCYTRIPTGGLTDEEFST